MDERPPEDEPDFGLKLKRRHITVDLDEGVRDG